MAKKLLNVAAGINLVIGGLLLIVSLLILNIQFFAVIGVGWTIVSLIRLVIGAVFLNIAKKDGNEFIKKRGYVLVASIISILIGHFITFILGIIAYSDMYSSLPTEAKINRELTEEEKSQRKLRNLLALGCALVLLAGIIFAMTTWTTLLGSGKTVALIGATIIFFGLSYFSEKKFMSKTLAVTYYILANAFCVFAFVAAGCFNIFGTWFSLNGEGASLYQSFLWILVAGLSYLAYLKYDNKNLYYGFDFSVLIALVWILNFWGFGKDVILFVVIFVSAVFALVPVKSEIMKKTNNLANIVLPLASFILFTFISYSKAGDRIIFNLMSFGIAFVAVYYIAVVNKDLFYEIFAPIFTIGTAFMLTSATGVDNKVIFLQFMLITVVVYLMGYYKRDQKWMFTATAVVCDLALLYILVDSLNLGYNYYAIAAALALLGTSIAVLASRKFDKYHFEILLEPVKVILFAYTIYKLAYRFDYMEDALFLTLVGFIFAVICIGRKGLMKKLYFIGSVVTVVFSMIVNAYVFAPIVSSFNVVSLGLLLIVTFKSNNDKLKNCKELIYGLELLALAFISLNTFGHFDLKLIGIIILTIIYAILFCVSGKNNIFRCFTIVALLVPYVTILPVSVWNDNVNYILYSLPWLALIFVYTRGFLKSVNLKTVNVIEIVTLSFWYLVVSLEVSLEVAVFIGIISFLALLIGYRSDNWFSLYYTGVAFLILNTLIQLKEFWTSIPVWAYILVAGLILIGIVTYKEYARVSKKGDSEKVEVEIIKQPKPDVLKKPIDIRTIVIGSILYVIFIPILLDIVL